MRAASRRQHSVVALTAASAVVVAGLGTLPEQSAALQPGPLATKNVVAPIPVLDWQPCLGGSLECTRATVPLDYDDPNGATTSLFLSRRPADRPANRIGTLFINPGGPGGPSSRFVRYFADRLGNKVLRRFDIVGIDPRGIGRSTRMHCHPAGTIPPDPREFIPLTAAKARPVIRYYTFLAEGCAATASEITDHMTTADTARDMDLIRQALGDAQLTYYGISYGSVLGATYAAMFPDSIRAMVLDGVVNPGAWYRGLHGDRVPVTTRIKSAVGAWESLVSAFAECDRVGRARCPAAGRIYDDWRDIMRRLRTGPAAVTGGKIYYSEVVDGTLGALYAPAAYKFLFRAIEGLHAELFDTGDSGKRSLVASFRRLADTGGRPYGLRGANRPAVTHRPSAPRKAPQYSLPFEGVTCADSLNPSNPRAWIRAGGLADRQAPWFGRDWAWFSNVCARWPESTSADGYHRGFKRTTSSPVLLVTNTHDPATPISGARALNSRFEGSRMLTLDQWGHVALGRSQCVTFATAAYLIFGELPPPGEVCRGNQPLFPGVG